MSLTLSNIPRAGVCRGPDGPQTRKEPGEGPWEGPGVRTNPAWGLVLCPPLHRKWGVRVVRHLVDPGRQRQPWENSGQLSMWIKCSSQTPCADLQGASAATCVQPLGRRPHGGWKAGKRGSCPTQPEIARAQWPQGPLLCPGRLHSSWALNRPQSWGHLFFVLFFPRKFCNPLSREVTGE